MITSTYVLLVRRVVKYLGRARAGPWHAVRTDLLRMGVLQL